MEVFWSDGGHTGPFKTLEDARAHAGACIKGIRHASGRIIYASIRPASTSKPSEEIERVYVALLDSEV